MRVKFFLMGLVCIGSCSHGGNEDEDQSAQPQFEKRNDLFPATALIRNAMDVAVEDLNKDGYPDIVLANEFQANTLLLSDGKGAFTDASTAFGTVVHDSEDIAIADFDDNGWLDIVFASEDDRVHEMYLNQGGGIFQNVSARLPASEANAVVSFDVNQDGSPDLLFGNNGQNVLLINKGHAEFVDETAQRLPSVAEVTQDLKVVDVDNDGDLDILEGNEGKNRILINNQGVFTEETETRLPDVGSIETRKITPHDFDKDGDIDLLVCNVGWRPGKRATNFIFKNDGKGIFKNGVIALPGVGGTNCLDGIFMDVNKDGQDDVILAFALGGNYCKVLIQHNGSFKEDNSAEFTREFGDWLGVLSADFDKNQKVDLFLANRGKASALFLQK